MEAQSSTPVHESHAALTSRARERVAATRTRAVNISLFTEPSRSVSIPLYGYALCGANEGESAFNEERGLDTLTLHEKELACPVMCSPRCSLNLTICRGGRVLCVISFF